MLRANVNEMNVDTIDLGDELRQRVELRLHLAPVVAGAPVLNERLQFRKWDALRLVIDGLAVGPPRRDDAPAQIDELCFRNMDGERADCLTFTGRDARVHGEETERACGRRAGQDAAP